MAGTSTSDGSVVIGVDMNVSDAEKELTKLKKKISQLEQEISNMQKKRDAAQQKGILGGAVLDAEKAKLQELKDRLADLRAMSRDKAIPVTAREEAKALIPSVAQELAEQRERVRGLQAEWNKVEDEVDKYNQKLEESEDKLTAMKTAAESIQQDIQNAPASAASKSSDTSKAESRIIRFTSQFSGMYKNLESLIAKSGEASAVLQDMAATTSGALSSGFQSAGTAIAGMSGELSACLAAAGPYVIAAAAIIAVVAKLAQAFWKAAKELNISFVNALRRGSEVVYEFGASVAKNFVAAMKSIGKFSEKFGKAIAAAVKSITEFMKSIDVFSKISDTFGKLLHRLGMMIRRVFVFSVITSGLRAVRSQMSAYLKLNSEFTTALARLKGALLTAFQPIYDVVVPALVTLINVLTQVIATVTNFFASLFGTTGKQAQNNAKALYNQAGALEATGAAAKEASLSLASFDEINQIQDNSSGGGGGGGGAAAELGALFDYDYDDTPFDSWGEAFNAFLDNLLQGIPQLEKSLDGVAETVNTFTENLYEMFTYPGVQEKAGQLGEEVARALDEHLVGGIDWDKMGRALGAGLNTALNFLNGFIYGGDSESDSQWKRLGKSLAEAFNGLVKEVDGYELGRTLWGGFKIGLETLAGFLENLDMPELANAASGIIQGFFDEMDNTINRIDWPRIGEQIATFLNEFQWYEALTSVFTAIADGITGLKDMVKGFLEKLDVDDITDQISRAVNESIDLVDWEDVGATLSSAIQTAMKFAEQLLEKIQWNEIGQQIANFILGFDFPAALGGLADLIAAAINAAIQLARGLLDNILPEVEGIASGISERIKNAVKSVPWGELGGVIGDGIKAALTFIAGLLDAETFAAIGTAIGDFLIGLDWPGIFGDLTNVLANAISSAVALVKNFLSSVKPHLKEIAENIAQKIDQFVEDVDWKELGETIGDGIDAALDFLIDFMDEMDRNGTWDKIGQAIADFLEGLDWNSLLEKWSTLLGKTMSAKMKVLDLSGAVDVGLNLIKGIAKGMWNEFQAGGGVLGWLERNLVKPIINGVFSLFGVASPSKVFAEIGEFLIAGLAKGITDTWHNITDFFSEKLEALKTFFSDTWENIKSAASEKWESIKASLGDIWENIKTGAKEKFEHIRDTVKDVWEAMKTTAADKWTAIKENLSDKWTSIRDAAKDKFEEVRKKVSDAWADIKTDVPKKWEEIKTALTTAWENVKTAAGEKFGDIRDTIKNKIEELKSHNWFDIGKSIVDGILSGLRSIFTGLASWASDVWGKITSSFSSNNAKSSISNSTSSSSSRPRRMAVQSLPDISAFNIPRLAQGAVIPPNREFLAVLGDQRSGTNIETPAALIRQMVMEGIRAAGGGSGGNITVIMELDGREFGHAVYKYGNAERQRVGVRLTEVRT